MTCPKNPDGPESFTEAANSGVGQITAARGTLIHRVEVDGEQVRNQQILAPAQCNFHPKGVVAQSLPTLKGPLSRVEQQACMLINTIDPCMGYELKLL